MLGSLSSEELNDNFFAEEAKRSYKWIIISGNLFLSIHFKDFSLFWYDLMLEKFCVTVVVCWLINDFLMGVTLKIITLLKWIEHFYIKVNLTFDYSYIC